MPWSLDRPCSWKSGCGFARPVQLGPNARVVRGQSSIRQPRPEATDIAGELFRLGRDRPNSPRSRHRLRSGPEHRLIAQVLAIMGAQGAGNRRRIDQPVERRLADQPEIDPLAEMAGGDVGLPDSPRSPTATAWAAETGRRHQQSGWSGSPSPPPRPRYDREAAARQGLCAARTGPRPPPIRPHPRSRPAGPAYSRGCRTGRSRATEWPQWAFSSGSSARAWAPVRCSSPSTPFAIACSKMASIAINLVLLRGDDQLATFAVVDLVAFEKRVERAPPLDAKIRLQ